MLSTCSNLNCSRISLQPAIDASGSIERWRAKINQMQRRVFASSNPRKMLQVSIKNVKDKLETTTKVPSVSPDLPSEGALTPRPKRQKLAQPDVVVLPKDEKQDQVYNDICLPRQDVGNLVYLVAKAIDAVKIPVKSNSIYPPCTTLSCTRPASTTGAQSSRGRSGSR